MAEIVSNKPVRGAARANYIVITMKGLQFIEKWYQAPRVPSRITRIYQLLLKLIHTKGRMTVSAAERIGYGGKVIDRALASSYVEIARGSIKLSEEIQKKIIEMAGKAPKKFYA